jgi:hypothetical protein
VEQRGLLSRYNDGVLAGWPVNQGSIPGSGKRVFSASRPALGPTHTPLKWVPEPLPLRVKCLGHEAHQLRPYSSEVKNGGCIPLLPHTSSWLGA